MLNKINKKIIIIISILVITIVTGIYGYISSKNEENTFDLNEMLETKSSENTENESTENIINENSNEVKNQKQEENKITIHITGQVKNTGIVELKEGARIIDAIKAAGGATKEANLDAVNLAYQLEDGQKLYIPNKNEKNEEITYITSESGDENNSNKKETTNQQSNKKVNINTATQAQLETLPGIGESIANRIIEYRTQNGKFKKVEDLQNVKGIGDSKLAKIKEYITVSN